MNDCEFSRDGDRITCQHCSASYAWDREKPFPQRSCPALGGGPGLFHRAANFARAVFVQAPLMAEAALTGDESKAFRGRGEIDSIAAICRGCPLFDGSACTHEMCGCPISEDRYHFFSKIAWHSQHCPIGNW